MDVGSKKLLEFYQNKFDELLKREDKYKEKTDKYLKQLIADKYELEAEIDRKVEKISDLQKALVDLQLSCFEEKARFLNVADENERLKRNEELLHKNIRQLLSHSKDKDLRDKIIYILQDPNVEILCRHVEGTSAGTSSVTKKKSTSDLLKDEIQQLQSKIDEYSKISKNNSDVILEDCRVALEKSKEKILEDEQEIRKLQKNLQKSESEIHGLRSSQSTHQSQSAEQLSRSRINVPSSSKSDDVIHRTSVQSPRPLASDMRDLKFSLASVTQISSKIESLLTNIKSSDIFIHTAKQRAARAVSKYAAETEILELQNCVRKSNRLTYDISNIWKSLSKEITEQNMTVRQRDIQQLEASITNLAVSSAEAEMITMGLSRAKFFDYLVNRTVSLSDLEDEDNVARDHSKCVADVVALEDKVKYAALSVKTATDIIERIDRNIDLGEKYESKSFPGRRYEEKQANTIHLSSSEPYIKTVPGSNMYQSNDFNPAVRRTRSEPIGGGEVTRRIDKTLSKIQQIERGDYAKDNELCRHLAEQIRSLSDRLKELCEEYNTRNVQDNFTEYSAVTLSKLETLARQSRDTVIAAEAQITAYRSKAQNLSQKLRDTEELLSVSLHECLGLRHELMKLQISRGPTDEDDECRAFLRTMNLRDADKPKSADKAFFRTIDFDGNETAVKKVPFRQTSPRRPEGPFECMFCKQGSDHEQCVEKIRELNATIRKLKVEIKTSEKEAKNEKKVALANKEGAEKAYLELENEKQSAKETITALESKNASHLEELKMLRNRLKNMERYRRCEIEGLQTDIKNLKTKIKDLEKQLTRAVLIFENGQKDMELLKTVHTTAQQSKSTVVAIKRLKAQLYGIETDIKRL